MTDQTKDALSSKPKGDALASRISELLLFHSLLGRGYNSPFPEIRGMVFTTALPAGVLEGKFTWAEREFRSFHEQQIHDRKVALEQAEQPQHPQHAFAAAVAGGQQANLKAKLKAEKEELSRRPHISWSELQVSRPTLVQLLKEHYYGAYTFIDRCGARLASSMCHPTRLACDLSLTQLMGASSEEALIRSNNTGGQQIHSLAACDPTRFDHFSSCSMKALQSLVTKIKTTDTGQVGKGTTLVIPARPAEPSDTTRETLASLAKRVFSQGHEPEEKRTKVSFSPTSAGAWREFLEWDLPDLIDDPDPSAWCWSFADNAPASPRLCVLFAARAAMVQAFITAAEADLHGPLREVVLDEQSLEDAKTMAKYLFRLSSEMEKLEAMQANLERGRMPFLSPDRLADAMEAMTIASMEAEEKRVARSSVVNKIKGATLGTVDELVRRGKLIELIGVEQCQMGKTKRAYTLPWLAPRSDEEDIANAVAEFKEAKEEYEACPEAFESEEIYDVVVELRTHSEHAMRQYLRPIIPLSHLSQKQRHFLPRILAEHSNSFLLRGPAVDIPEWPAILEEAEEDFADGNNYPIDPGGATLWCRVAGDGTPHFTGDRDGSSLADYQDALGLLPWWKERYRRPVEVVDCDREEAPTVPA